MVYVYKKVIFHVFLILATITLHGAKTNKCKDMHNIVLQVPKEKCSTFERDPKPPVCRTANRLECKNVPQEECRQVIDTKCQQVPRQKCQTPKKSKCQQICEPVYWCKVCQL